MKKIAITGNIASGKSIVQKILQDKGYSVLDTDIIGHEILRNSPQIIETFREYDVFEEGKISREKLGKLVFSNKILLEKLNSLTHPLIKQKIEEFFIKHNNEDKVFVGIPLVFEAKMENLFDEIVLVYAQDELRLKRLMLRNGFTKEYALQRIKAQMSQQEKLQKAHKVISNEGSIEDLIECVNIMF